MGEARIWEGLLTEEARLQRLMAAMMLGAGIVVCAAFSVFDLLVTGYCLDATIEAGGVIVYAVVLWALLQGQPLSLVVHVLAVTTTAMVIVAVVNGRADHAVLVWPLIVPPMAFLLVGLRWGWIYVTAALAGSAAALVTHAAANVVLLANFLGGFLVVTLLTLYFALGRHHAFAALRRAAETDFLTGVANRRRFHAHYDAVRTTAATTGQPLALMVIDADRFKTINDTAGHEAGDRAVVHLTTVIAGVLRPDDLLARIGGEEFAVLLPDTSLPEAVALAEAVRRAVADSDPALPLPGWRLTVSIGVAVAAPEDGEGFAGHFARADDRLYSAKAAGRDRVVAEDGVVGAGLMPN